MRAFAQKENQSQKPVCYSPALPAVQRILHTHDEELKAELTGTTSPRSGRDFSRIPLHSPAIGVIQTKLAINQPGDEHEQEADRLAQRIMDGAYAGNGQAAQPEIMRLGEKEPIQTKLSIQQADEDSGFESERRLESQLSGSKGRGIPLPVEVRAFMEPRFRADFSQVRVHTDAEAVRLNRSLNAQAFTHKQDIYFGAGKTPGNDALTAHELTHVLQQSGSTFVNNAPRKQATNAPAVQRVVELRPPGRGEASAFDRRDELVARLNAQSAAIEYSLDDRVLKYEVKDEAALKNFDRQMMKFIDQAPVLPMRLITSAGRVGGGGVFSPVIADAFASGYVDLDDLLAADDLAFQSILVHFLTERAVVKNYDRRIGTPSLGTDAVFVPAHEAGHEAQAEHFRAVFDDPSIKFNYEEIKPNGSAHIVFKSHSQGYRVFLIIHRIRGEVSKSEVKVQTTDKRWLTVEKFLEEQTAAAVGAGG